MSTRGPSNIDHRLLDLLADRALDALAPTDAGELDRLITFVEPGFDPECLERVAAALAVALAAPDRTPIPTGVLDRLHDAASSWGGQGDGSSREAGPAPDHG